MVRSVIVLGMHRSGTSLVSNILIQLGVFMGSEFRKPDSTQPNGYFEDIRWRDVNKAIINRAHGSWYCPPDHEMIRIHGQQFAADIAALVQRQEGALWGFKDPRTSLTAHVLHPFLPQPHYVIATRSRDAVIESLVARSHLRGYHEPREHWHRLCQIYHERIVAFLSEFKPPAIIVNYEQLTNRRTAPCAIRALARFIGVEAREDALQVIRFRS